MTPKEVSFIYYHNNDIIGMENYHGDFAEMLDNAIASATDISENMNIPLREIKIKEKIMTDKIEVIDINMGDACTNEDAL